MYIDIIEVSLYTIFNMGYGSGKSPMGERASLTHGLSFRTIIKTVVYSQYFLRFLMGTSCHKDENQL